MFVKMLDQIIMLLYYEVAKCSYAVGNVSRLDYFPLWVTANLNTGWQCGALLPCSEMTCVSHPISLSKKILVIGSFLK